MKVALYCVLFFSALLYYPFYPFEEFETPKVAMLLTFACFSLCAVKWQRLFKDNIAICLTLFIASMGISTLTSIDWRGSLFGNPKLPNGLLVWLSYLVFYMALLQSMKGRRKNDLVYLMIMAATIVSGYAISQVLGYDFKTWYGGLSEHGYMRPMSTLGHPNFMAAYLSMVLPFTLWRFDQGVRFERVLMACSCLALSFAIIFSQSRGMWWATLSGVICYFIASHAPLKRYLSFIAMCCTILIVSMLASKASYQGLTERALLSTSIGKDRIEYLKGAARIFKHYPFLGSGTDTYELAFQHQRTKEYWDLQANGSPHRAHNEYLNILATQGLLGALCFLILTLGVFVRARLSQSPFKAPAIAAIVAFYIQEISSFHVLATCIVIITCLFLLKSEHHEQA